MIDLSGTPLHKRGYRPETVEAPIRETLAAAMVKISRPREDVLLWDPFCGSGTIAIEAAMQMRNIAPGINRSFSAEEYPIFPKESWKNAREKAKAAIKTDTKFEAYATDIDLKCVEIASAAAKRAGVDDMLNIFTMDALDHRHTRTPRNYRDKPSLRRQTSYRGRGERPLPRDGAGNSHGSTGWQFTS